MERGHFGPAYLLARHAARMEPGNAEAVRLAGLALAGAGEFAAASQLLRQAATAEPWRADWLHDLGVARMGAADWNGAISALRSSLALEPDSGDSRAALGTALESAAEAAVSDGEDSLARRRYRELAALDPHRSEWRRRLAAACIRAGDSPGAIAALQAARQLEPGDPALHSTLLYCLLDSPAQTGESLLAAHREWGQQAAAARRRFDNTPDPSRRLRVGVLTGDFGSGSSRWFLPPLLREVDPAAIELFAYDSGGEAADEHRAVFKHWRRVAAGSDGSATRTIRGDRIDVLVDVAGHLPNHRLGVFQLRAAPVQIAYPRYPGTTGIGAMDFRVSDEWADPAGGTESHYSERLLRMRGGYLAWMPPGEAPRAGPLPAGSNGFVTFGFFLTPLHLNAGVIGAIARVLRRVRRSRLLIHYDVPDFDRAGRWARRRIEDAFARQGVQPERLRFHGPLDHAAHLKLVAGVDIALDSFPYSGQTNTCECLWMGVPVVTLAGSRFASRVSASILNQAGLADWIVASLDGYVAVAAAKAADLEGLAKLRRSIRRRLRASPLMDYGRAGRELERVCREAWRDWCERQSNNIR